MNKDKKTEIDGGLTFLIFLTLVFLILKLTGAVDWSWWIILLPALIPVGMFVIILLIIVLFWK